MLITVRPETLKPVLSNLLAWLAENPESEKIFCEEFDDFLDDLSFDDFFGTEGQCDPRGDQRV